MIASCTPDGHLMIEGNIETRIQAGGQDWRAAAEEELRSRGYKTVGAWSHDLEGNQVIQIELVSAPHLPPTAEQAQDRPEPR